MLAPSGNGLRTDLADRIYKQVEIEFDPEKDATNIAKHGISLARASDIEVLDFLLIDRRGERHLKVMDVIDGELFALICVFRRNALRAISLRRAHNEELD